MDRRIKIVLIGFLTVADNEDELNFKTDHQRQSKYAQTYNVYILLLLSTFDTKITKICLLLIIKKF